VAFTAYSASEATMRERQNTAATGEIVAKGRISIVAMDPATERPRPIPDELRRALTSA
jgi:acyl-CoA thioesterase FadM